MEERTILITGGTSGIGDALVHRFLRGEWNVVTCGMNGAAISRLEMEGNPRLLVVAADIRLENQLANLLEETVSRFGKLDGCILNAGTLGPAPLPAVLDTDLMDLRRTFETNLFANFNLLRKVFPLLSGNAMLVHLTSDAAVKPYPGWGAYGSSKAAMRQIIEVLAVELEGNGVRVMNFDPGDVDTRMHRLAIPGADVSSLRTPQEVAEQLYSSFVEGME